MSKVFPIQKMLLKIAGYNLARSGLIKPLMPLTVTYSVTNMCQSRCKTCNLWELYKHKPHLKKNELTLDEIEKIFKSMGHIYFFNISGGEPYLRKDLPEIVDLACKYLKPGVIHIPTNALTPDLIEKNTRKILDVIKANKLNIPLTIKPSFDGIGKEHDKIRGIKGNFKKLLETIKRLKALQKEYPNLDVGVGTVISVYNINKIKEISDYVEKLNVDSYINEIAERRSELFTLNRDITPSAKDYEEAINIFSKAIKKELKTKKRLTRITQAFRLLYYKIVVRILKEKRQVIPCYAGLTNAHINPYGEVWPCCILGYEKPMGDLRKVNYDFKKIWYSKKADSVRNYIKKGRCYCPLANQAYSNILCDIPSMIKVIRNMFL